MGAKRRRTSGGYQGYLTICLHGAFIRLEIVWIIVVCLKQANMSRSKLSMNLSKKSQCSGEYPSKLWRTYRYYSRKYWCCDQFRRLRQLTFITSQFLSQKPARTGHPGASMTLSQRGRIDIFNKLGCRQALMSQFNFHDPSCNRGCVILSDPKRKTKCIERRMISKISRYILKVYMDLNINHWWRG